MRRALLLLLLLAGRVSAQTGGSISGHVRQRAGHTGLAGGEVGLDGRWVTHTDSSGFYRIREVRSGWHLVTVRAIGFESARRDSVLVRAGQISVVNFVIDVYTIERPIVVEAFADSILDPALVATVQRISGEELRRFPVTTLEEAVALSAGAVGESYRGGRLGQQAFVLDGLGVKNQLDASTGPLGIHIPPDILTEAARAAGWDLYGATVRIALCGATFAIRSSLQVRHPVRAGAARQRQPAERAPAARNQCVHRRPPLRLFRSPVHSRDVDRTARLPV